MTHAEKVKSRTQKSAGREPIPKSTDEKIDAQVADSFPASDPPSFSGGTHFIGAPEGRETPSAKEDEEPSKNNHR